MGFMEAVGAGYKNHFRFRGRVFGLSQNND
jgi:hypothetical protein